MYSSPKANNAAIMDDVVAASAAFLAPPKAGAEVQQSLKFVRFSPSSGEIFSLAQILSQIICFERSRVLGRVMPTRCRCRYRCHSSWRHSPESSKWISNKIARSAKTAHYNTSIFSDKVCERRFLALVLGSW